VALRRGDDIPVLRVAGSWPRVVEDLHRELLQTLAVGPRAVVGDLSDAHGAIAPDELRPLVSVGALVREWPGTVVALTSPESRVRAALRRQPHGRHLYVAPTPQQAVAAMGSEPAPSHAALRLAPACTAARAARDFVARTCLDWQMAAAIPAACLVVSELVTNGVVHARTDVEVHLFALGGRLRIAVRDGAAAPPRVRPPDEHRLGGRGVALVDRLAHTWGCLPTGDGGKVVWAVIRD
jgi:hypothetical protein